MTDEEVKRREREAGERAEVLLDVFEDAGWHHTPVENVWPIERDARMEKILR